MTKVVRCSGCKCPYEDDEIPEIFSKERRTVRVAHDGASATGQRFQRVGPLQLKNVCSPCIKFGEQELLTDPWGPVTDQDCMSKACKTRYRHRGLVPGGVPELRDRHGWETKRMAHGFAHASDNCCPYCEVAFRYMRHGLGELTIDIIDRSAAPTWGTNTTIPCLNCNASKQCRTREQWDAYLRAMRRWARWRDKPGDAGDLLTMEQLALAFDLSPPLARPAIVMAPPTIIPSAPISTTSLFPDRDFYAEGLAAARRALESNRESA